MSKAQLIAIVATAVMLNGERVVIQPGEPLPDLKKTDEDELIATKAARPIANEAAPAQAQAPMKADVDADAAPEPTPRPTPKKGAAPKT